MAIGITVLLFLSVAALWFGWRSRGKDQRYLLAGGWLALALGVCLWGFRFADSGVAISISTVVLAAFAALTFSAVRAYQGRELKIKQVKSFKPISNTDRLTGEKLAVRITSFIGIALLATMVGLSSALAAMRLVTWMSGSEANAIVTAYTVTPLACAGFFAYVAMERRIIRKLLALVIVGAISLLIVAFGNVGAAA
ncbi:MAG: hypothetical protein AAFY83_10775 [Pseudomonadota bacterium]